MPGSDKDGVAIDIEVAGETVARKEVIAEAEIALHGLPGDEKTVEDLSGGVIEGQKKGIFLFSKPEVDGTVQKDQLSFSFRTGTSFSSSIFTGSGLEETGLKKPGPYGLSGDGDLVFFLEDIGEMGNVEVGVTGTEETKDFLFDFFWISIMRSTAAISVDEGLWTQFLDLFLEAFEVSEGDI